MSDALFTENASYLSTLYQQYKNNPDAVDKKWQRVFRDIDPTAVGTFDETAIVHSLRVLSLIQSYRERGHLAAALDPLGIEKPTKYPELNPEHYGFTANDYDKPVYTDNVLALGSTLRRILEKLNTIYCGVVGAEFMHLQDPVEKSWIQERFENFIKPKTNHYKILTHLTRAEFFEKFLNVKFPGAKRFSLEGCESLIPALEKILEIYTEDEANEIYLGMAHRGRLNILANILHQPIRHIIGLFQGHDLNLENFYISGDVKYHLGYSNERVVSGKKLFLSLSPNPSHLEAVNSVVLGKVRSRQDQKNDNKRRAAAAILLHGDAAFSGQGSVAESLGLFALNGYKTGGTLHIILNNQIGFTTSPSQARSSVYPSDIAKAIQAPIFHVNADFPEEVVWVSELAADFVRTFKKEAVIDMICYRRHGHNEADEPAFTQPIMYKTISQHKTTRTLYIEKLKNSNKLDDGTIDRIANEVQQFLDDEFKSSFSLKESQTPTKEKVKSKEFKTGVDIEKLKRLGLAICTIPEDFSLNPKLKRQLEQRAQKLKNNEPLDWATSEALALASILSEGNPIRLSGQDSCRGTFSHRHAVLINQENENCYIPLNNLGLKQARFEAIDSPLTEAAVLGFDYGYSVANPDTLVIWEAQFGDFSNGAQVIIDQFISSGGQKWSEYSGIVMLLPHGMEGQGPEHSSARLERYLQLCAEDNMRVVNCTTPANFFHSLRRQLYSDSKIPLIVMTPKSLLRHKNAVSMLSEMDENTHFLPVITEENRKNPSRVILCSGKIYYELAEIREQRKANDIVLIRLEQYYPFPEFDLSEALKIYKNTPIIWCQEEPKNMGAWNFIDRRLEKVLKNFNTEHQRPYYVGRKEAASPATGIAGRHEKEQDELIQKALFGTLEEH